MAEGVGLIVRRSPCDDRWNATHVGSAEHARLGVGEPGERPGGLGGVVLGDRGAGGACSAGSSWGARLGPRDMVSMHHVLDGEMRLEAGGGDIRVGPGDLVVLPHGTPHAVRHRPGAPVVDEAHWRKERQAALSVRHSHGGDGPATVVLCVELRVDGAAREVLMRALPPAVHLPAGESAAVFDGLLPLLREEVPERRAGTHRSPPGQRSC
ncbi:cupin domain-containing protein [Sinosporangium siamense]|uniref:AraC-type transcription regulator ligand-binding domain-containing protein n=1 Tax=Sinosporangium siamense TaxID=1367973 RepID=A0A919RPE5_9ACTN|nr:cupin domain-containing protein [Sinosporangium siamense]GII97495.1 hypothetical protein Ssi02_77260 [Sinosporangium siamense]